MTLPQNNEDRNTLLKQTKINF